MEENALGKIMTEEIKNEIIAVDEAAIKRSKDRDITADRRREQFEMRLRGMKRETIVEELGERYGVLKTTIDQDWQRRKDWLLDVVGVTDVTNLVATTLGSLNLSQVFRKQILESLLDLAGRFSPEPNKELTESDIAKLDELPVVWNMLMKLLNDMDSSEKGKADILLKLGILKEAPKKYIVDKKVTTVEHKVDWKSITEGMDENARMKLFDAVDSIEIEGSAIGEDEDE